MSMTQKMSQKNVSENESKFFSDKWVTNMSQSFRKLFHIWVTQLYYIKHPYKFNHVMNYFNSRPPTSGASVS